MITHENVARPQGLYGTTKVWGEALGRHFADTYGLSVLCVADRRRPRRQPRGRSDHGG